MKIRIRALLLAAMMLVSLIPAMSAADAMEVTLPSGITEADFGENTVTDGTNYYATMMDALVGIHLTDKNTLYCNPGADVGRMDHGHVCRSLTVYGNGAYISGGEQDFEVDVYNYCHYGAGDCSGVDADLTLTVNNLTGAGAWGNRDSNHKVTLVFNGCKNMGKVYITGTAGDNNISLENCSFDGNTVSNCKIYSNANGSVTLKNVEFSNVDVPVNLNHKVAGTQTITLEGCSFDTCGSGAEDYMSPVRVLSSVEGASSALTVTDCTFTGTVANSVGQTADILLDYGVGTTTAEVTGTDAEAVFETAANTGTSTEITADNDVSIAGDGQVTSVYAGPVYAGPVMNWVKVNAAENGVVKSGPLAASAGATITLYPKAAEGYVLDTVSVLDAEGNTVELDGLKFQVPAGGVTVSATFKPAQ